MENSGIRKYPAKVLLFGEYGVLLGSKALSLPYPKFNGYLQKLPQSNTDWKGLVDYLDKISDKLKNKIDLSRLKADMINGLQFQSSIPVNYGLGSSGALVA